MVIESEDYIPWFEMSTDTVWASSCGEWSRAPDPRPWAWQSVRRHQIRLPRTDLPPTDNPGSTGTNDRA